MLDSYINNFENIISSTLFVSFKIILIILVVLLILSLILLAVGCLIKSQKLKSKFLKIAPELIILIILILSLPYVFIKIKQLF